MGRPVRRSTRGPKKESSSFSVGDTVEVERNGERVQGSLLTERGSGRWSVQVGGKQEEFPAEQLYSIDTTETDSAGSSQNTNRVSAREVRSRRRQEVEPTKKTKRKSSPTITTTTTSSKSTVQTVSKRQRTTGEDPECVKIKLLTGTLLLYRGRNQRAEFVRRV